MKNNMWLVWDGTIHPETVLRSVGWTDEMFRAPYACRVRERTDEPIDNKRDELIDDIEALCLSIEKDKTSYLDSLRN